MEMMKTTVAVAGVFAVVLCSHSLAAAPKSSDAKNSAKPTRSAVESEFLKEKKARYAAQDKSLQKADELAKNGKFMEAIKLYKQVKFELSQDDESVESWVAKRRFKEVSARLREMELSYGGKKLEEAGIALDEKRYNVAIDLANEAIQASQELSAKGNKIKADAVTLRKADELKSTVSPDTGRVTFLGFLSPSWGLVASG